MKLLHGPCCLAEFPIPPKGMSWAFFCLGCGDVWARVIHEGALLTAPIVKPCELHPEAYSSIPGSFFQGFHFLPEERIPSILASNPNLLRHEFKVSMMWAERNLNE